MPLRIVDGRLRIHALTARQPFRYGIVTVLGLPHLFLEIDAEIDGRRSRGIAAENLAPKWFAKDPRTSPDDDVAALLASVRHSLDCTLGQTAPTPFILWRALYGVQRAWGEANGQPLLLAHFGATLVERAVLDAVCRDAGRPFHEMLHADALGLRLGELDPDLNGARPADLLPARPLPRVTVRHTVGLLDPLTEADADAAGLVDDGLPRSLSACVHADGLRHFKLKIGGDPDADAARIERVLATLAGCAQGDWRFSVDGNEAYREIAPLRELWRRLERLPDLRRILFLEQPFHRDIALTPAIGDALRAWPDRPPILIDESDAGIESLPVALGLGYAGTSHKNCKGVFKGVLNACRLRRHGGMLSGEDLSTVGPVALPADLAVQATLGIQSVERNGHHYFAGLSGFPVGLRDAALAAQPDLWRQTGAGWPAVRVCDGALGLETVNAAPLGVGLLPDLSEIEICE